MSKNIEEFQVFNNFSQFYPIFSEKQREDNRMPRNRVYEEAEREFIQKYGARAYSSYNSFKNRLNDNVKSKKI